MTLELPKPVPALLAPGSLPSRSDPIELHTLQGVHLFLGQQRQGSRPGHPGLRQFARHVGEAYRNAALDDPWADWKLIQVEEALERSALELSQLDGRLAERLAQCPVRPADEPCLSPTRIAFQFASPYGYLGARLLQQYDAYVRRLVHARHAALLTRDQLSRWIREGRRRVIRAWLSAMGYRAMGVARRDLDPMTSLAAKAALRMGELPPEIADGSKRAAHAPTIMGRGRAGTRID